MYSVHSTPYWERQRNEPRKKKYKEKKKKKERAKKETNNKRMEDQLLGLGETKERPKRNRETKDQREDREPR